MDKPKVLLPLLNVPMLDYVMEFLVAAGVQVSGLGSEKEESWSRGRLEDGDRVVEETHARMLAVYCARPHRGH